MLLEPMTSKAYTERPRIDKEHLRKSAMVEKSKMEEAIKKAEDMAAIHSENTRQLLANHQPTEQIRRTLEDHLKKGHIDVKV